MAIAVSVIGTTFIVNGHTFEGWSDDADALMMPDEVELVQVTRGADGKLIASHTGIMGGPVSVKLQANSPSVAFMFQQFENLRRGGVTVFNGSVTYESGASVLMERGILTTGPLGQTLGSGPAATRVFRWEFETVSPNYDGAAFTAPPRVN